MPRPEDDTRDATLMDQPELSALTYVQAVLARLNAESPGLDPDLARLYALLALTRGADTTLEDVHDAWALHRMTTRPDHPSLVPFDELTVEVQELDGEFQQAIHRAAEAAR